MTKNNNYLEELNTDLNHIFGGHLKDMSIRSNLDDLTSMGGGGLVYSHEAHAVHELTLHVELSVADMLKLKGAGRVNSSVDFASLCVFGDYNPKLVSQCQDFSTAAMSMKIVYVIDNLDNFLEALHKKAWTHYDKRMNDLIDEVLEEPSD